MKIKYCKMSLHMWRVPTSVDWQRTCGCHIVNYIVNAIINRNTLISVTAYVKLMFCDVFVRVCTTTSYTVSSFWKGETFQGLLPESCSSPPSNIPFLPSVLRICTQCSVLTSTLKILSVPGTWRCTPALTPGAEKGGEKPSAGPSERGLGRLWAEVTAGLAGMCNGPHLFTFGQRAPTADERLQVRWLALHRMFIWARARRISTMQDQRSSLLSLSSVCDFVFHFRFGLKIKSWVDVWDLTEGTQK